MPLFAVFIYSRARPLYAIYANAPSRFQRVNNLQQRNIKFADGVRNCEDVLLDATEGFALLSCDPGRDTWNTVMGSFGDPKTHDETGIYMWDYADTSNSSQPEMLSLLDFYDRAEDFHPLGIEYDSTSQTLLVVNHAASGSRIEVFKLFPDEYAASYVRTVEHPFLAAPNAIAAISETEFFVTNDHYFRCRYHPMLSVLETYSGLPGGTVAYINMGSSLSSATVDSEVVARVPFANGIALLNSSTLAVASSSTNSVYLYNITRGNGIGAPRLTYLRSIKVQFHPDNLSVDRNGNLLIAGHPHGPTLESIAKDSARCNAPGSVGKEGCDAKGLSWISEWSEKDGLKTLYAGDDFATSTTAVRDVDRNVGIAGGLYERGILTWID